MRFSRPSTGTILGAIALFVALSGTALAATGTVVNIADPTTASHVAHVDANGKLQIGGGPVSLSGTATTQIAPPSAYVHRFGFDNSSTCAVIAQPPTGKAMIIRDVRIDVFQDPSPGISQLVALYDDTTCSDLVADVNPPTVGETVLPFDPGLGIAAGSALSMVTNGSVAAEVYTDGYSVPSNQVPAAPAGAARTESPQEH
jgi:hypothetical protein